MQISKRKRERKRNDRKLIEQKGKIKSTRLIKENSKGLYFHVDDHELDSFDETKKKVIIQSYDKVST